MKIKNVDAKINISDETSKKTVKKLAYFKVARN